VRKVRFGSRVVRIYIFLIGEIAISRESGYEFMVPGVRKIGFGSRGVLIYKFLIGEMAISHERGHEFRVYFGLPSAPQSDLRSLSMVGFRLLYAYQRTL
jgi:hypothetical protein